MTKLQLRVIAAVSLLATALIFVTGARPSASAEAIRVAANRAITVAASLPASASPLATPVAATFGAAPAGSVAAAVSQSPAVAAPQSDAGEDGESDADEGGGEDAVTDELKASRIGHVFLIALTSSGYEKTWGEGSTAEFLTQYLRPQGTLLSGFGPLDEAALPNYVAAVSGQPPNPDTQDECSTYTEFKTGTVADDDGIVAGRGCSYPQTVLTLADRVTAAGFQWKGYMGDQASGPETEADSCRRPLPDEPDLTEHGRVGDQYATRHNPFVYFHSLLDLGACFTQAVDLGQLETDLESEATTPNLSFISPNLCDSGTESPCVDGRPGGLATADAWLEEWVPKIQNSDAYIKDGLIVVAFLSDATTKGTVAGPTGPSGPTGPTGAAPAEAVAGIARTSGARASKAPPPTGLLLVSQYADPSATEESRYDPYSLLRTLSEVFGVEPLANAADAESFKGMIATAFG